MRKPKCLNYQRSVMTLGVAVKLGLFLGLAGYQATTVLAAAPIGQTFR
jgi:hypothetical protein